MAHIAGPIRVLNQDTGSAGWPETLAVASSSDELTSTMARQRLSGS